MKAYFEIQYKLINRTFREANIAPLAAIALLIIVFLGFSMLLFYKTSFAQYIYVGTGLAFISKLSDTRRTEFLALCFGDALVRKIRILENSVLAVPFLAFLLYENCFLAGITLLIFAFAFALINVRKQSNFTLPTPFYRKPFEFTIGFRNTFYLIFIAYGLAVIAVSVNNLSLGVFAMIFIFAITITYYTKPEDEFFVWSYNTTARRFLYQKIKTATVFSTLLVFPIFALLGIFFFRDSGTLLLFFLAGWAFLPCVIVCKYAAFPDELSVTQGVLLALCISFPPLLLFVTRYYFKESENRLNRILT